MKIPARWTRITLAHEFTHAVHAKIEGLKHMYVEPLGETVLKEGFAMHSSRHIVPGGPASAYTPAMSYGASWQKTCIHKQRAILEGMLPYLDNATTKVTEKFTFGKGTTGLHDEVYCAGWIIVGKLLNDGYTYASLAGIPETGMPGFVAQAISRALPGKAGEKPPKRGTIPTESIPGTGLHPQLRRYGSRALVAAPPPGALVSQKLHDAWPCHTAPHNVVSPRHPQLQ